MEDQQLERKFRELGQGIQELKNNATTDMQLLKMMLGCSLGLQLVIFLVLIFGENLTNWLGLTLNSWRGFFKAKKNFQREHVTPYIWDYPKKFKINNYENSSNYNYYKKIRLTLDYKEDYKLLKKIVEKKGGFASRQEINSFLSNNKHLLKINFKKTLDWKKKQSAFKIPTTKYNL